MGSTKSKQLVHYNRVNFCQPSLIHWRGYLGFLYNFVLPIEIWRFLLIILDRHKTSKLCHLSIYFPYRDDLSFPHFKSTYYKSKTQYRERRIIIS